MTQFEENTRSISFIPSWNLLGTHASFRDLRTLQLTHPNHSYESHNCRVYIPPILLRGRDVTEADANGELLEGCELFCVNRNSSVI